MFSKKEEHNKAIDSLIGENIKIVGKIEGTGNIRVDGYIEGDMNYKGDIVISNTGRVKGNITC